MASALNVFKTVTYNVTNSAANVYTAPAGYTSIVLMANISNITSTAKQITFSHYAGTTTTELLKDFSIPGNDAVSATTGKLILEEGQSVRVVGSANSSMKLVLSILETLNG